MITGRKAREKLGYIPQHSWRKQATAKPEPELASVNR
jgi:hypothetical protein